MDNKEKFEFGVEYQESILKFTVTDTNGYQALALYKDSYFDLLEHQIVAKGLHDFYEKRRRIPDKNILKEKLRKLYLSKDFADALTKDDKENITKLINDLYKGKVKDGDEILESCIQFARFVELKDTLEKIDVTNFAEYETYARKIKTAITVGRDFKKEKGTFLIADLKDRQYRRHAEDTIFRTPYAQINSATNAGGYNRHTVICLMGKEKEFKTAMLINTATAYVAKKKNVLYVDLENNEDNLSARAEQSIKGLTKRELLSGDYDKDMQKLFRRYRRIKSGELVIKRMSAYRTTTNDIQNYIDECYREYGIKFDVMICDYAAILGATSGATEDFGRISDAYVDLKNLAEANDFETVWTANHVTREAEKRKETKYHANDIAKCKDIGRHVDALFGLQQSAEELSEGRIRLEIIEQRDGYSSGSMFFHIIPEKQIIREFKREEVKEIRKTHGAEPDL